MNLKVRKERNPNELHYQITPFSLSVRPTAAAAGAATADREKRKLRFFVHTKIIRRRRLLSQSVSQSGKISISSPSMGKVERNLLLPSLFT